MVERGPDEPKSHTKPRWSWSGAEALNFSEPIHDLERLVAMLPEKKTSDNEILAYVVDLRARFQRWLHQDEFGPTRRQQTAALRALKKSIQTLQRQLTKVTLWQRAQLDALLRNCNDTRVPILDRIYEAASDLENGLLFGESDRKVDWATKIKACAETMMVQSHLLDTNADSEIFLIAIHHKFDLMQTCRPDFGLAAAEHWLNAYWNIVDKTLCELDERSGAEERVSLKFLVEQLCELWERETARLVTAHGMSGLEYTQRTETDAGRFVTAAIEAMLPEQSWFDQHSEFSHPARAQTFLPVRQPDRARQIIVIMREFVKRRSKSHLHKKVASNSVNAVPPLPSVAMQNEQKPCSADASPRPDIGRTQTPAPCTCHQGIGD
jgi:hypothetical protein